MMGPLGRKRPTAGERRGAIAWMATNPVAANLLMLVLLIGGGFAVTTVQQEVFPSFEMNWVSVTVPYPGASPAESEEIVASIEQAVSPVDGVKAISASASEGVASVFVELLHDADTSKATQDVKAAVDRITTIPQDAEQPNVSLFLNRREVISVVFYGDVGEGILRELADDARTSLKGLGDITVVEQQGVRAREMSIEVSREQLRHYALSPEQVAGRIRAQAAEIPGGGIKTASGEKLLRTPPKPKTREAFEALPLLTGPEGGSLRVADVGRVVDGFEDTEDRATYNGKPAVMLKVFRVADQTPTAVADAVKAWVAERATTLPDGVDVATWFDWSEMYRERRDLLVRNALLGFLLVLLTLGLFLETRVAFWVTLGIPVSFLGAILLMPSIDVSINMISMFAFIVTLGIVVDDAIVVGEAIFMRKQQGQPLIDAAIDGTHDVARPVSFSILTTIVAFAPMLFVPGVAGNIFSVIPAIVISVLAMSWVESFFILPAHLAHETRVRPLWQRILMWGGLLMVVGGVAAGGAGIPAWRGLLAGLAVGVAVPFALTLISTLFAFLRGYTTRGLQWFIHNPFKRALYFFTVNRGLAVTGSLALFFVAVGTCASGRLPFTFMPKVESDIVMVDASLPFGVPMSDTEAVETRLVEGAREVLDEMGGVDEVSRGIFAQLGRGTPSGGPVNFAGGFAGTHVTSVQILLVPTDKRNFTASEFVKRWRARVGDPPNVRTLIFKDSIGPGAGFPIDLKLSHPDQDTLEAAAAELAVALRDFAGVKDVDDGVQAGKPQIDFGPNAFGVALGLTRADIGRQLRGHLYGAEALRQQRGIDEMKVMVRLPEAQRETELDVGALMIMTPAGREVPLRSVSTMKRGRAFTTISRSDEARSIRVKADIDRAVTAPEKVYAEFLEPDGILPMLATKYRGLRYETEGEAKEQRESMASLQGNGMLALFVIFALIAIPFRSYLHPVAVLFAIPLGAGAAIYGHMLTGHGLSFISILGIVALSGVVINDSLVLVDAANTYRRDEGMSAMEAIRAAAIRRFRPILLTSLTTFFGLAPMIFETSMQARFLVPMAVALGFGILLALPFVLISVPAMYLLLEDLRRGLGIGKRAGAAAAAPGVEMEMEPEPEVTRG